MSSKHWPDNLVEAICDILQEKRLKKGLTVYALSQESGVSQQAIAYIERKSRRPTVESLARLSGGLGMKLSELIALAEKKANNQR